MKKGFAFYYFSCFCLFAVITPNLQLFLEAQGWDYFSIGLLQGVYQLVGVCGPLVVGSLADRMGRYRPFILGGYLLLIPAFFFLGRAEALILAMITMGIIGIGLKSIVPLSDTLLSRSLEDPEMDYGKLRIWGSIGFLVFGFFLDLSGILEGDISRPFLRLIYLTTGLSLLGMLFLPSSKSTKSQGAHHSRSHVKIPRLFWGVMVLLFFGWMANSAYFSFFSLFLREYTPIEKVNIQWALGALFEIPLMFLSGALLRRWGLKRLMIVTLAVLSLRLMLYAWLRDPMLLSLSQILHALSFGLFHSLSVAAVNRFVPAGRKALAMAIYSAFVRGGAAFVGSTLGGWISQQWGIPRLFFIYGLLVLPILIVFCFLPGRMLEWKAEEPQSSNT